MINHKVLIIEDDPNSLKLLQDFLNVKGFQTSYAKDGLTAVEYVKKEKYDIILLDLRLPGQNGYITAEKIRETKYGKNTPILVTTAFSDEQNKLRAYKAGANFIINKPINTRELYYIITNLLQQQNERHDF